MNGGAGRIPSGFCTLARAVYKWAQLHETLLKACPPMLLGAPSAGGAARSGIRSLQALPD